MLPSCYQEKPIVAAGLRVWRLAAWIRDCISGKKVVKQFRLTCDKFSYLGPNAGVH